MHKMPKVGRPTLYSPELAEAICKRMSAGESLRKICTFEGMPPTSTVMRWLLAHPEFREQYEQAREAQADFLADEMLQIADDSSRDYIDTETGKKLNAEYVQRSRLRVDTRKWLLSKLFPKKYGDLVRVADAEGNKLPEPATVDPIELARRILFLVTSAQQAAEDEKRTLEHNPQ